MVYENYKESNIAWYGSIPLHWNTIKGRFLFKNKKNINSELQCNDRLSLTMNGVIERDIDSNEGLNPADFSTYQIFEKDNLVFKLIDLDNKKTSRVGYVHKKGIMSSAYIRLIKNNSEINTRYFYYQYYDLYLKYVYNYLGSGVRSTLNSDDLLDIELIVPPQDEQNKIVNFIDQKSTQIEKFIQNKTRFIDLLKEQKEALINEAVTKGLDSSVEFKDSEVDWLGEIPKHWEIKKLQYLGKLQNGINIGAEYFGTGFPFVSYGDVYKNYSIPLKVDGLVESTEIDRRLYSVQENDVIFTRTSETVEEIGFSSTCLETIDNSTFAGFLIRFRPKKNILHKYYSKYYFRSKLHRGFFVKEMNLVTRASLSQELLKLLPVVLPPIEEQKQIVEYIENELNQIDKLIEKTTKEIELIKEYKTSLINEAVSGKIKVG